MCEGSIFFFFFKKEGKQGLLFLLSTTKQTSVKTCERNFDFIIDIFLPQEIFFCCLLQQQLHLACNNICQNTCFVLELLTQQIQVTDLQHCLLVLTILHLSRGEVDESPRHTVLLCVVEVGIWSSHYNVSFYPSIGIGLQNMYVTFLGNNGAAEF